MPWKLDFGSLLCPDDIGLQGEKLALKELKRRGYQILKHRFRNRLGEIDIVALDGETLVFVEVKSRTRTDFGPAIDGVDHVKRKKLRKLAASYLKRYHHGEELFARFDVVGVTLLPGERAQVEVIQGAFEDV